MFGNVGTIIAFRVGAEDAEFLEKEFMPEFLQNDLVNLSKANIYIKLMIYGRGRPARFLRKPCRRRQYPASRCDYQEFPRPLWDTKKCRGVTDCERMEHEGGAAGAAKIEQQKEKRLSEVLVPNARTKTAPAARNVWDVEPRRAAMGGPEAKPMTVAIREGRKNIAAGCPSAGTGDDASSRVAVEAPQISPTPQAPQGPKVLHPNVDIDALKWAINESLRKKEE